MENVIEVLEKQRNFFFNGETLSLDFRLEQLNKLEHSIFANMDTLLRAFNDDFNKQEFDVFTTEVGMVLEEIKFMKKHLGKFIRGKKARGGIANFPSKALLKPQPLGQVLIIAPWNYPFQLAMIPLVGAIACGNTVILKPSANSENVAKCIKKILSVFDEDYIAVALGNREQNQTLLEQKFDLIFFTGSKPVGRIVQQKAGVHLCPVVLELGGKSPCIIDEDCDLKATVRRVVWGKYLNAGQTCVAPDYIFVHTKIYEDFLAMATQQIKDFYYPEDKLTKDFPYIITDSQTERIKKLIDKTKLVCGGKVKKRLIEPTILRDVTYNDAIMQEEIFGPIMPVIKYENLDNVFEYINSHDKPLALYYFGRTRETIRRVIKETYSGGVCINETIMHVGTNTIPFGGVGESGMGSYHGMQSLYTFSHIKPILFKRPRCETKFKYPPLTRFKKFITYKILGIKR